MKRRSNRMLLPLFLCFLISGLTTNTVSGNEAAKVPEKIISSYHTVQLAECKTLPIPTGMMKKVDNFMVIFDPSASMTEEYIASTDCVTCHGQYKDLEITTQHMKDYGWDPVLLETTPLAQDVPLTPVCLECHHDYLFNKYKLAKDLAYCFNQTIPDLELISVLRTYGDPVYTRGNVPEKYSKKQFAHELRGILGADGVSPLDLSLSAAGKDWFGSEGKIAVIIISDGEDMPEKPVLASEKLKERYGNDICIYTIHVGDDVTGRITLDKVAKAGECGISVSADELLDQKKMESYVYDIFLKQAPPLPPKPEPVKIADSDGDGVTDDKDDCPGTKEGLVVDENGCWSPIIWADILFDFDKYNLKPEGQKTLDQIVDYLNKYPFLSLKMGGHTDNFGSMKYNIALSKRRVESGQKYLTKNGIVPDRISVSWHSFSVPRATNETVEGRALNRRIEFKFHK